MAVTTPSTSFLFSSETPGPGSSKIGTLVLSTTTIYPTIAPKLPTEFTPPPQCTDSLTMLGSASGYFVFNNEPLPAPSMTFTNCHPHQFVSSYLDYQSGTISPAFNPVVCPQSYYTARSKTTDLEELYIVCCPESYQFAPPSTTIKHREYFGGVCYTPISSISVLSYEDFETNTVLFSTAGQGFAHPIDGIARKEKATTTSPPVATSSSLGTSSHRGLGGETIAGPVIGGIGGLIVLLGLLWWVLRKYRAWKREREKGERDQVANLRNRYIDVNHANSTATASDLAVLEREAQ